MTRTLRSPLTTLAAAILLAPALLAPVLLFSTPAVADVANEPPSVEITSPSSGQMFEGTPTAMIDVVLSTYDGDEGIASVLLRVDGETLATDDAAPWGFDAVEIGEGAHSLVAVAVSAADGAQYPSMPVDIVVFAASGTDGTGDTGGTGDAGGTGDSGSNDNGDGSSDDGNKGGCDCVVSDNTRLGGSGGLILLGLCALGLARRRRD